MKDCFDIWADVRSLIELPELLEHIDGQIYELIRPGGRKQTDIVINSIGATNQQVQQSIVNINIHAQYLEIIQNGMASPVADRQKYEFLSDIIVPLVANQHRNDFFTTVERPPITRKDTDGTWFCNIRLRWNSIQTNFKNI